MSPAGGYSGDKGLADSQFAGCVHCSLLPQVKEETQGDLQLVAVFLVPGIFFLIISLRWSYLLISRWAQAAHCLDLELAGLPLPPSQTTEVECGFSPLPWEGFVKIVLTALATILTMSLTTSSTTESLLVTSIYLIFLLSGLVDVLVFYCGYIILPEGIQSFILAISFALEALAFYSLSTPSSSHAISLLILVILAASLASILEVTLDHRLVKFSRTFFTLLQSTWLLHLTSLLSSQQEASWTSLLFCGHLTGLFLLLLLVMLVSVRCQQEGRKEVTSAGGSASQLVPCRMMPLQLQPPMMMSPGNTKLNMGESTPTIVYKGEGTNTMIYKGEGAKVPSVVDVEPWDKLMYSTFNRPINC